MARIAAQPKISDLIAAGEIAPVKPPTERPGLPAIPTQDPGHAIHFRGPLADGDWDRGDASRQWYGKNVPQSRISPPQPAQSASLNATIQSTAAPIIAAAIAAQPPSSGGLSSVGLSMPEIFSVTNSPLTSNGTIDVALVPEPAHTFLRDASTPGLNSIAAIAAATGTGSSITTPTLTFTPPIPSGWAFYVESGPASVGIPAGWTSFGNSSFVQSFASQSPITVSDPTGTASSWCTNAVIFSGAMPSLGTVTTFFPTQSGGTIGTGSSAITNVSNGTILIVFTLNQGSSKFASGFSVSDTLGSTYTQLFQNNAGPSSLGLGQRTSTQVVFIATGVTGGANTVNVSIGGLSPNTGTFGCTVNICQLGALPIGAGIPFFGSITAGDVPGLPASKITSGLLDVSIGGTGADLSGTGAANNVVFQTSAGAPLTVGTIDYPNLRGVAVATRYANNTLVGKGIPSIVFQDQRSRTGNDTINGGFLTSPVTGLYRVTATLVAIVGSSGIGDVIPQCSFTYNDPTLASNTIILTPTTPYLASGTYTTQSVILAITSASPSSFTTTGYAGTGTYQIITMVEAI